MRLLALGMLLLLPAPSRAQQNPSTIDIAKAYGLDSFGQMAEKLVECAIEDKQAWAFQQIVDRLEGKPMQPVEHTEADKRTVVNSPTTS